MMCSVTAPVPRRERLRLATIDEIKQVARDQMARDGAATLSLRAVAREVSIAATSVYLHFPDRDALVLAVMHRCHEDMLRTGDSAEAEHVDPAARLRARMLAMCAWANAHPGLYKVMHESKVNRRYDTKFKEVLGERITAAVQRCMDAGLAPNDDAVTVTVDLRTAMLGLLSSRINEPDLPWPPAVEQIDRFLVKLVGLAPTVTEQ